MKNITKKNFITLSYDKKKLFEKKRFISNVAKKNDSSNKIFLYWKNRFFFNKNLKKKSVPIININELITKFPISMARGYNENKLNRTKSNLFLW